MGGSNPKTHTAPTLFVGRKLEDSLKNHKLICNLGFKLEKMKRDKVLDTVKELPREFELETLIEKLVFVEKVEQGILQLKKGKTQSHEKVKEMAKKW